MCAKMVMKERIAQCVAMALSTMTKIVTMQTLITVMVVPICANMLTLHIATIILVLWKEPSCAAKRVFA